MNDDDLLGTSWAIRTTESLVASTGWDEGWVDTFLTVLIDEVDERRRPLLRRWGAREVDEPLSFIFQNQVLLTPFFDKC